MDNANILQIGAIEFENQADREKYNKWHEGAYSPMFVSTKLQLASEHYQVFKEEPEYPSYVALAYYENLEDFLEMRRTAEFSAMRKDVAETWKGRVKTRWYNVYQLVKRLTSDAAVFDKNRVYAPDKAPVTLLYGVCLSAGDWKKYCEWFDEWGYPVYTPLLIKVPGVTEYSRWWLSNIRFSQPTSPSGQPSGVIFPQPGVTEDSNYPQDLSIIYFEDFEAYQTFEKSREFAAFKKNLLNEFPNGLNNKMNVVYRLISRTTR